MKPTHFILLVLLIGACGALFYCGSTLDYTHSQNQDRIKIINQTTRCNAYYHKMWDAVHQNSNLSNRFKPSFQQIYPALIKNTWEFKQSKALYFYIVNRHPKYTLMQYAVLQQTLGALRQHYYADQKILRQQKQNYFQQYHVQDDHPYPFVFPGGTAANTVLSYKIHSTDMIMQVIFN